MSKTDKILSVLFLLLLLGFAVGLWQLFELRFSSGDIYPPYSSLRTDPLGTAALCEALDGVTGFTVQRHYGSLAKLSADNATIFISGTPESWLHRQPEEDIESLDKLLRSGNRVVITTSPLQPKEVLTFLEELLADKKHGSLMDRWGGFSIKTAETEAESFEAYPEVTLSHSPISWHSKRYFDSLDAGWRVMYTCEERPVIVERNVGRGTVVLATDSFFLSNEALRQERRPQLLAWLIGSNRLVIFDEAHLGVEESPGIATLGRRYNLHWLFFAIVSLGLLFVWKNAIHFVPPHREELTEITVARDSIAGLLQLLRRNVAPAKILPLCFKEWQKSFAHRKDLLAKAECMQEVVTGQKDPVASYRAMSRILRERKNNK